LENRWGRTIKAEEKLKMMIGFRLSSFKTIKIYFLKETQINTYKNVQKYYCAGRAILIYSVTCFFFFNLLKIASNSKKITRPSGSSGSNSSGWVSD
jgi:hypothetical protein